MAKFRYRRFQNDDGSVDMTPMLDIVFIMLIFFIVTAVFLDERGLDFTTPIGDSHNSSGTTIQIYVDKKDRVSVDQIPVRLQAVPARVERLMADKPDANIVLRTEQSARLDPVVFIKDQMNQMSRHTIVKVIK